MRTAIINDKYPYYLWLLSILIAPMVFFIYSMIYTFQIVTDIDTYLYFLVMLGIGGFLYGLPALLVAILFFAYYTKRESKYLKPLLALILIVTVFLTILICFGAKALDRNNGGIGFHYAVAYSISIIISTLLCRVHKRVTA